MAVTDVLRLVIDADVNGAVTGIEKVGQTSKRELDKSKQTIDQWGAGLKAAGAALIGVGSAALFGLGRAAAASEEANLATVKLENTLQNMPLLAGESSKQFIDLADSIQDVTAADADAIVEAEALLGTFQLTADEIKRITPLVVDYARKFGIDIPDAAVQVGKALDGQVGALKRNGVSIDEAAFAADRFGAVQKALREQVGGFAEAEGKTFAGSLERLKNQLGDVVEGVGTGAVDAFTSMFGVVEGLTDRFKNLSPEAQNAIGQIATFGSVGAIAAGGLSLVIGQVISMHRNFTVAKSAIADFIGAGGLGGLARTVGKGGILIAALVGLEEVLDSVFGDNTKIAGANLGELEASLVRFGRNGQVTGELLSVVGEDFEDLKDALGTVDTSGIENARASVDRFASSIPLAGRALGTGFAKDIDEAKRTLDDFDKALANIASQDPDQAFSILEQAADALGISVEELRPALDDYNAAVGNVAANAELAGSPVDEFGRSLEGNAEDADAAKEALQQYSDTLSAMLDPLFGATDALMANQEAQASVKAAEMELIAAVQEHGATSVEAMEAQHKLTEAQQTAGQSAVDLHGAMVTLKSGIDNGTVSVDQAKAMLQTWVAQGLISQSTADALAASFTGAADQANVLGATDPNVEVTASGVGTTISWLEAVTTKVNDIPKSVTVSIGFNVYGQAELNRALALRDLYGGQRAHGGPVMGGRLYEVAEQGRAELLEMGNRTYLIPGSDGTVVPAGSWGGGGGGGGSYMHTVNLHFHGPTNDTQVIEAIKRYERSNGPAWRN